jgi:hypothetical protein
MPPTTLTLILAWTIGSMLLLTSLYLSILNATVFYQLYIQKRSAPSWIPLLGGALGVFALILIPLKIANKLAWLPLVLDPGSLPGLLLTLVVHIHRIVRPRN